MVQASHSEKALPSQQLPDGEGLAAPALLQGGSNVEPAMARAEIIISSEIPAGEIGEIREINGINRIDRIDNIDIGINSINKIDIDNDSIAEIAVAISSKADTISGIATIVPPDFDGDTEWIDPIFESSEGSEISRQVLHILRGIEIAKGNTHIVELIDRSFAATKAKIGK